MLFLSNALIATFRYKRTLSVGFVKDHVLPINDGGGSWNGGVRSEAPFLASLLPDIHLTCRNEILLLVELKSGNACVEEG
ncbi:hypothetical protein TIFTF001_026855 [Ficus carica]|uniref:Uncharacterized protein n=1 Tax=Ficus carica TaxID=3494 RepID=A0AA88DMY3_FICCA|nr:hypothetical protein TIFTF001_026855 [Ficus carica]